MCSINGFTFQDKELIQKMNLATKHRGPDATNIFISDQISLGHNRLSIIDVREVANQPMTTDEGRYTLVFNGEIYNFQEIKKELSEYTFVTNGDTEVILKGYQKWGKEIFSKLNGMYALAIWDTHTKELVLARDPQGVKPLYYSIQNNQLIFSSEIKAILEHPIERVLDKEAFALYMDVLYVPAPFTMFKHVSKLEAGTTLTFLDGIVTKEVISFKAAASGVANAKTLETLVDDAIQRQLISDRPVGVFLSGGIDSSVVLDSVSRVHKHIDTFSLSFDLGDLETERKFNIDARLAKKTAEIYGTNHHEISLSTSKVLDVLGAVIVQLDEPIANPTVVATYVLSQFAKEKVDVVLGGDGADELFAGYERYRLSYISDWYQRIVPKYLRTKLDSFPKMQKLNLSGVYRYGLFHFQNTESSQRIIQSEGKYDSYTFFQTFFNRSDKSVTEQILLADQYTWLIDESLMRSDKMSMAHSLEQRVPLLDLELISFAHRVPVWKKVSFFKKKKILREAFQRRLPKYLFTQPKRGWFSPAAKWMRDETFLAKMKETLSPEYYSGTKDMFDWEEVHKMLVRHVEGTSYNRSILWAIFVFQIWAKKYKVTL